jgi:hypothetical protein
MTSQVFPFHVIEQLLSPFVAIKSVIPGRGEDGGT